MTVAVADLSSASRILRDALKDKSYRSTPLGLEVARYIRWKRNEWGAAKDTIRDYEPALARLAVFFADLEMKDFETPMGAERLRECWDYHWGESAARTRAKILSIWRDFFDWAIREGRGIHGNPARVLRAPKRRGVKREPFEGNLVSTIVAAQDYPADRLGVRLILEYGLRRGEIAAVRLQDFDFGRQQLVVTGKGAKVRHVPIPDPVFWRELAGFELAIGGHVNVSKLFLVCPRRRISTGETRYFHHHGFVPRSVHTWWYDRLEAAGLAGGKESGTRKGLNMHRGRHTVATEILRGSGNLVAAQKLLGHADLSTTEEHYATFDTEDVANVLRAVRGIGEDK